MVSHWLLTQLAYILIRCYYVYLCGWFESGLSICSSAKFSRRGFLFVVWLVSDAGFSWHQRNLELLDDLNSWSIAFVRFTFLPMYNCIWVYKCNPWPIWPCLGLRHVIKRQLQHHSYYVCFLQLKYNWSRKLIFATDVIDDCLAIWWF